MMLSMPAEAMYLQDGYKSRAITDYLWPLSVRMRVGYYYAGLFIRILSNL